MRLINASSLQLEEYSGSQIPEYAILSHTWGSEEITLQEWSNLKAIQSREGFRKIASACHQAQKDNLQYLWADTNCIDKTSSSELSEAINSMFSWYQRARVCYAYLDDVVSSQKEEETSRINVGFSKCRWFTRGWTLQELLAPQQVIFFSQNWRRLGTKISLQGQLSSVTGIAMEHLSMREFSDVSVATKMSWLSMRITTRVEDIAYCMLGIFDINMPLLYGEGHKAFLRLQAEIIKQTNDHTIFCWAFNEHVSDDWESVFAPNPRAFEFSSTFVEAEPLSVESVPTYSVTNAGLSIRLPLVPTVYGVFGMLNALDRSHPATQRVGIPLITPRRYLNADNEHHDADMDYDNMEIVSDVWVRVKYPQRPVVIWDFKAPSLSRIPERIFINSKPRLRLPSRISNSTPLWVARPPRAFWKGVLLIFDARPSQLPWISTYPPSRLNDSNIIEVALEPGPGTQGVIVRFGRRGWSGRTINIFFGVKMHDPEGNEGDQPSVAWVYKFLPDIEDGKLNTTLARVLKGYNGADDESEPELEKSIMSYRWVDRLSFSPSLQPNADQEVVQACLTISF